jgi:hypothetical protein
MNLLKCFRTYVPLDHSELVILGSPFLQWGQWMMDSLSCQSIIHIYDIHRSLSSQ